MIQGVRMTQRWLQHSKSIISIYHQSDSKSIHIPQTIIDEKIQPQRYSYDYPKDIETEEIKRNSAPHFDKASPQYVCSELDEHAEELRVSDYNKIIKDLKSDLNLQRKIHEALNKLKRPYLDGIPGLDRNIDNKIHDYSTHLCPKEVISDGEKEEIEEYNKRYSNENRWAGQALFYPKYPLASHEIEWKKTLDERPINPDFHKIKGSKYDVEVPYEKRYNYFADRLGHPELLGTPWDRLLRLESEIYHPENLDQPFVKIPSTEPNADLNFENGEILYENKGVMEWGRFWKGSALVGLVWGALWVPYNYFFKTHLSASHYSYSLSIPWHFNSIYAWDAMGLMAPLASLAIALSVYTAVSNIDVYAKTYVIKAQYNKDKELLFITRLGPFGGLIEDVYEMGHLAMLPPSKLGGVQHLSAQDSNGLFDITCQFSKRSLAFYKEDKYWNCELKKEFLDQMYQLWTKSYVGLTIQEEQEQIQRNPIIIDEGAPLRGIE